MKTVIRHGVFETNSSSTHSLTINKVVIQTTREKVYAVDSANYMLSEEGFANRTFLIKSPVGKLFMLKAVINASMTSRDPYTKKFWKATVSEYRKMFGVTGSIKEHIITEIYKKSYRYNRHLKEGWSHEKIMKEDRPRNLFNYYDITGFKSGRYPKEVVEFNEQDDWAIDPYAEPWMLCSWFYADEPLSCCTCQFGANGLEDVLHLSSCRNFAELARWYLSDDIFLVGGEECLDSSPSNREI